jgi:2-amino-4-hydroxy-6-hydroxymethyldihydropteridine diphosphokinase
MQGIFIALGSNLGNRDNALLHARQAIALLGEILAVSSIVETPALLPEHAPRSWDIPYKNQVLQLLTSLSADGLFIELQQIERKIGGAHVGHWAPRVIDIDLLAFHGHCQITPDLTLPHARMHERAFVLQPLAEIAPHWVHPVLGKTARELYASLREHA